MSKVTFDYSKAASFISEEEVGYMSKLVDLSLIHILLGLPNLVRLESRDIKLPGAEEITIRDLIKSALRMRPNRIIVGECRGACLLYTSWTSDPGSFRKAWCHGLSGR